MENRIMQLLKNRNVFILLFISLCIFGYLFYSNNKIERVDISKLDLQDGDIIFQTSSSAQSQAIQLATDSKYSHCGLLFYHQDKWQVLEAIQPVKYTFIDKWIKRGKNSHYVIKRLDSELNSKQQKLLKTQAETYLGKNYDLAFEWSDNKIYCSELVWKVYKKSLNINVGKLQKLADFDLSHPAVQKKMKQRYGKNIPLNEIVISPQAAFESKNLILVDEN